MSAVNVVPPGRCWRLVHDGSQIIQFFESKGTTESIHTIFTAATQAECETEIARLGLTPIPPEPLPEGE